MTSVVGQAMDEFQSAAKQLTSGTQSTMGATASTPSTISLKARSSKGLKVSPDQDVLEIMQRVESLPKRAKFDPHGLSKIGKAPTMQQNSSSPLIGSGLQASSRPDEVNSPVKAKPPMGKRPTGYLKQDSGKLKEIKEEADNDMKSLSSMVQQMTALDKQ